MIILTYGQVISPDFCQAFAKLSNHTGFDSFKTAYNVSRLAKKLDSEYKIIGKLHVEVVKKYAEVDDKGELIPYEEGGPGSFKIREGVKDEWLKAIDEFNKTELTIDRYPIPHDQLEGVALSPQEIQVLDALFVENETPIEAPVSVVK